MGRGGGGRGVTPSAPRSSCSPGALTRVPARPCATACVCVCVSACEPTCRTRVPRVHSRVGKAASLGVTGGEEVMACQQGCGGRGPYRWVRAVTGQGCGASGEEPEVGAALPLT